MKKKTSEKSKTVFLINIYLLVLLFISINSDNDGTQTGTLTSQIDNSQNNTWVNATMSQQYEDLNHQLQSLNEQFVSHFLDVYHVHKSKLLKSVKDESLASQLNLVNIKNQTGNYLLLLAKMYLYDFLPKSDFSGNTWNMYQTQSRYLLGYFYFKIAAQKYSNPEAYYYLALLDYYKLNPHQTFIQNLQKQIQKISKEVGFDKVYELKYQQLLDHLKNQRFTSVQHNLFFSSMLGHHGSSFVLANMLRQGLGMDKNCTSALAYYLSIVKETYVDIYEFRSSYSDQKNFEKELYAKRKVVFENQQNVDVISSSQFFDSQTIKSTYQLAENYFIGRGGFKKNYEKAADLYAKLATQDHKHSQAMLGMCYFKGQGVPLDRKKARVLFQSSNKVSISQAMLIVMDYFEIQSKGNRAYSIKRMKQIYDKKKDLMNPILKFLFGSLIVKGDIKEIKLDDGVLLLGSAAKQGHLMAKITMGLLFADGIDVNYDCIRSVHYFAQQGLSHPFFMDKFYMARIGLKNQLKSFSLLKYLELSTIGDTNSFINALYILEIEQEQNLGLNQNSWNINRASNNVLYQKLRKQRVVPDIYSYFQKQYSFLGQKSMKYETLQRLLEGNPDSGAKQLQYIKKKIIKVCAITKENSLMNFYEHKMRETEDVSLLSRISNGQPDKLHVLEARYLLGQYYHKKSFQSIASGKDHTKDQYKSLQQYKRATNSPIIGKVLFYLEQIILNPFGINFDDELFQFGFINDLLTYTFVLSILMFILYYKRSKKLDQIHRKQLEKRQDQIRLKNQEDEFKKKFGNASQQNQQNNIHMDNQSSQNAIQNRQNGPTRDESQPQILEQRPQSSGIRIGSSYEDEALVLQQVSKQQQNQMRREDQSQTADAYSSFSQEKDNQK